MPSQIKVDEIKNVAGQYKIKTDTLEGQANTATNAKLHTDSTVESEGGAATTKVSQGLAKIYFALNCTGTPANRGSFNVSTVTDGGSGNMTENFTSNMNDQNYSTSGIAGGNAGTWADSLDHYYVASPCQTSSIQLAVSYHSSLTDGERVAGQICGDLA